MGILEMDFERILGVPFFNVVLTPSCCDSVTSNFKWKIFSNFVAFSEYPNFNKIPFFFKGMILSKNVKVLKNVLEHGLLPCGETALNHVEVELIHVR